jgi:hypothetical protein
LPKKKFSLIGMSFIIFLLLGLANLSLRYLAQAGEPGTGETRFLWVMVDVIRLFQLAAMGIFIFSVIRGCWVKTKGMPRSPAGTVVTKKGDDS